MCQCFYLKFPFIGVRRTNLKEKKPDHFTLDFHVQSTRNKKNLPRTSRENFNSFKTLSSKNKWPLFDLVTNDCQRLKAVGCRCRRGTFAFQLSKNVGQITIPKRG